MQISIYPRSPEYIPSKKSDTDAGYDLRACIKIAIVDQQIGKLAKLNKPSKVWINGQAIKIPNFRAAAEDIYATLKAEHFPEDSVIVILPNTTEIVSAGFKIALPQADKGFNTVMQIYPRSGLGINSNLILANSVGIVDCNYTKSEVCMGLYNSSEYAHIILDRARVAQALFTSVADCHFEIQTNWDDSTDRGGGLGHSGVK